MHLNSKETVYFVSHTYEEVSHTFQALVYRQVGTALYLNPVVITFLYCEFNTTTKKVCQELIEARVGPSDLAEDVGSHNNRTKEATAKMYMHITIFVP
jgi:hypothetical protein